LLVEAQNIRRWAAIAADPGTSNDALAALGNTLPHSVGGLLVLILVMALNVYKPPGLTSYGLRKQSEGRAAPAAR
jgi:hypothetical protein